jgi:hypothetical protein
MCGSSFDQFVRAWNARELAFVKWGSDDTLTREARDDYKFWRHHAARKTPLDGRLS